MNVSLREVEEYWSLDDLADYEEAADYIEDIQVTQALIDEKKYSK